MNPFDYGQTWSKKTQEKTKLINPPTGDRSTEQKTSWTSEKNGTDDELHGQIFETTRNEHHLLQTIRRSGHLNSDFLSKTPSKCWSKIRETNKSIRQRNRTKPPKNFIPPWRHLKGPFCPWNFDQKAERKLHQTLSNEINQKDLSICGKESLKPKEHPKLDYFPFYIAFIRF